MAAYEKRVSLESARSIISKRLEKIDGTDAGRRFRAAERQLVSALQTGKIQAKAQFILGSLGWDFHPPGWDPEPPFQAEALTPDGPYVERKVPKEMWSDYSIIIWRASLVHHDIRDGKEIYKSVEITLKDLNHLWPTISQESAPGIRKRSRGKPPEKRLRVENQMKKDIELGQMTLADLNRMKEEALARKYGAARDTVRKARNAILSRNLTPQYARDSATKSATKSNK